MIPSEFATFAAFLVFGSVLSSHTSIVIVAAEDILAKTKIPSTIVLMAYNLPQFCFAIVAPYFIQKCSYWSKIVFVTSAYIAGMLLIAIPAGVQWKLAGVVLVSTGKGIGTLSFSALTAYYDESSVSAFFTGSGTGYFFATLYYTAMSIFGGVSPSTTIVILVASPLLFPVMYYVLPKSDRHSVALATSYNTGAYSALISEEGGETVQLSCMEKFGLVWINLKQFGANFSSMFCRFLVSFAVLTTLVFPNNSLGPRNHYVIYTLVMSFGQMIGRSYGTFMTCIKPDMSPYTTQTWLFSAIQEELLIFLVFSSWFRFLESVWIVLLIALLVGALNGIVYLNTIAVTGREHRNINVSTKTKVEFSRAFVSSAADFGQFVAVMVGLKVEPILSNHCKMIVTNEELCLTRSMDSWNWN